MYVYVCMYVCMHSQGRERSAEHRVRHGEGGVVELQREQELQHERGGERAERPRARVAALRLVPRARAAAVAEDGEEEGICQPQRREDEEPGRTHHTIGT